MKKLICMIVVIILAIMTGCSGGAGTAGPGESKPQAAVPIKTLKLATLQAENVDTMNVYVKNFEKNNPGYTVEITAIPGVAAFNAAMASKLAAGDPPDIMTYQWGTQIQLYAKGGHLMDLSNKGFEDKIKPIKKKLNVYEGKTYAFPSQQDFFGIFMSMDVAKKYGVTEIPKTLSEFLAACETMQKNGLAAPIVIPAKDGSGATQFNFGYLHQVISGKNPDFYKETLDGTKKWNGQEFQDLFRDYGKLLKYANKDLLGLDPDGAFKRFAKEEAAFYFGGSYNIISIRTLNPNQNFVMAPTPWVEDAKDNVAISDYNNAISISSKTKYPEAALAFLNEMFTVESGNLLAKNVSTISSVKGTMTSFDKSLDNVIPILDKGNYVGFSEREWIPGIKEIMKKATQDWMSGVDLKMVLDRMEMEHQRLLNATPEFKKEFMEMREKSK
ncbi:extracellular solute-binding protein [Paenibacillus sp. WQ 127069]|uniref:Extracellular solute-binding protein n=1 Tax=Paenibacillus baimaensis TaxID=2982185 RepID=A0ABT2UR06_9BACL|nr:extracellular solute-binding protein [Paenibacillus sp. WQ 127069]MCU6796451.1 extracellular solute-binding protein [Paenibacillus sp. WQ 127069]